MTTFYVSQERNIGMCSGPCSVACGPGVLDIISDSTKGLLFSVVN